MLLEGLLGSSIRVEMTPDSPIGDPGDDAVVDTVKDCDLLDSGAPVAQAHDLADLLLAELCAAVLFSFGPTTGVRSVAFSVIEVLVTGAPDQVVAPVI
jgi:hypothetical protein